MLGFKGVAWIQTTEQYLLYNEIPQLKLVIDRKAKMFANMKIKLVDKKSGEEIVDDDLFKLLNAPNPLDRSQNEFLFNYKCQLEVYGNQFIYKNKPSGLTKYPISMSNISARYMRPKLTGKVFDQIELSGIIENYSYYQFGELITYKTEDILYSRLTDLDSPIIGRCPLDSLKFPLTNTRLAYEFLNAISAEKGAIGILSNDQGSDIGGSVPMTPEQKTAISKDYSNHYGVGPGKAAIMLTEAKVKWQPMTFPTKDLMLFEQLDSYLETIIDHYGLNVNMFGVGKATYENVKNGLIQAYENTIIPEAELFCQRLTEFLGIDPKHKLIPSYEHVNILNEDKLKGAQALSYLTQSLSQMVELGLLDKQVALDIYAEELGLKNAKVPAVDPATQEDPAK